MANSNRKIPFMPPLPINWDWLSVKRFLVRAKELLEKSIRTDELVMLGIESLDVDLTEFGGKGSLVTKNFALVTDAEANAHLIGCSISQADQETILGSNQTGNADPWPLSLFSNGARRFRIATDGGLIAYAADGAAPTGGSKGVGTLNVPGGYYVNGVNISTVYAPSGAKYIVQQADAGLANAQDLSALATGLLKSTTTTGVLSIAALGTDYGDVVGQSSSVDSEIALFSGTGGKTIKRATGTGVVHATSGVYSTSNVVESEITLADNTTNDVTSTKHGFAPKSPGSATQFLNGAATPAFAAVKDSDLSTSDITTNDVTSSKHGFAPKSPGDATKFMNGAATPAYALVKDSDLSTSDITTNDVTTSKHGFTPKAPNDTTKFLRGDATWAAPSSGGDVQYAEATRTAGDVTTTSTTFTDLTGMSVTLTTGAHRCKVHFICNAFVSGNATVFFDLLVDGSSVGGSQGISVYTCAANGNSAPVGFTFMTAVLSAASHTIKIQWKTQSTFTATAKANSTTSPLILGITETGLTT